jgi:hypothetical protein
MLALRPTVLLGAISQLQGADDRVGTLSSSGPLFYALAPLGFREDLFLEIRSIEETLPLLPSTISLANLMCKFF